MSLANGARLGPYEVLAPLGAGGMGEVYRARDTRLGREVAIKVLPAERLPTRAAAARFVQEARAASALNHPHIVTIHEIASAEGTDFIVMELVPGKTLDALIPKHGMRARRGAEGRDPDRGRAGRRPRRGHRPPRPQAGERDGDPEGVVKVLDFGLAKLVGGEEGAARGRHDAGRPGEAQPPGDGRRARRPTCRPSRRPAARSTRAATSSASGPCSTRW